MHITRAAFGGLVIVVGATLAACGGGGTTSAGSPRIVPTSQATQAVAATAVSGTTPISGVGSVPIPAPSGYTATITLPSGTTVPPGETIKTTVSETQPESVVAFSTARAAQAIRRTQLAGATALGFVQITPGIAITITPGTSVTFGTPSLTLPTGSSVYAAVLDTASTVGWVYDPSTVTCTATTTAATCTTSQAFPLVAGDTYVLALYTQATLPGSGTVAVTGIGTVPLPAPSGYSAALDIAAGTTIPAGETLATTVSATIPTGLAPFAAPSATPIGFISVTPALAVTVASGSTATFAAPSLAVPSGSSVYAALLDVSSGSGWTYDASQISCTFAGNAATCATAQSYTLAAGDQYVLALYVEPTIVDTAFVSGATYGMTTTSTSLVTRYQQTVFGGQTPVPSPTPYTTVTTSNLTVVGNQSFNGRSGLEALTSVQTGSPPPGYSAYADTTTEYDGLRAITGGQELDYYGGVESESDTSGGSTSTAATQLTEDIPLLQFPDVAGTAFAAPVANTLLESFTTTGTLNETYQVTEANDGSIIATDSVGSPSTVDFTETTTASPITDTVVSIGSRTETKTYGAPVSVNGGYVIPFSDVYSGGASPVPSPTATTIPLWYPSGPTTPLDQTTYKQNGMTALPAGCTVPANVGSVFTESEDTETSLSPSNGEYETTTTKSYFAPIGQVCSIQSSTQTFFALPNSSLAPGTETEMDTYTSTSVLTSYAPPASASGVRRTASVGTTAARFAFPVHRFTLDLARLRRANAARRQAASQTRNP